MHAKKEEFSLELLSFFIIKRISEYTDVLGKTHRYYYDELSRLQREDDEVFGFTTFYTYNGGNITSVTKYPYTADEFPSGTGSTLTYHYAQGSDKLLYTIFDGAQ